MNGVEDRDVLGRGIAAVLRVGTLAAMAAVGIGYLGLLVTDGRPGPSPLLQLLVGGGAAALIGIGLLGLTLIPAVVLGVAAVGFGRQGERRLVTTALVTLALLVVGLVAAAALVPAG